MSAAVHLIYPPVWSLAFGRVSVTEMDLNSPVMPAPLLQSDMTIREFKWQLICLLETAAH